MRKLGIKKTIAVMVTLTSLAALTACGSEDANTVASNQGNGDAAVTAEENKEEEKSAQTNVEVSMDSLLSHAETPAEDFDYSTSDGYVHINGYMGTDPIVVIPELIDGCPVKTVSTLGHQGIQAIKFSNSVEVIGSQCFGFDEDIQYVVFGDNIKRIADRAFLGCKNLKEVQLNNSLEVIEEGALATIAATELHIPESVIEIGGGAFNMDATQTLYVKAGSYAEQHCIEVTDTYDNLTYVVE